MKEIDPLVKSLIALCKKEGDHRTVADKANISPENLWQIINGTKLPSGNPRGVGTGLRAKLSAAYPGWRDTDPAPSPAPTTAVNFSDDALMLAEWFDKLTDKIDREVAYNLAFAEILSLMAKRAAGRAAAHTAPQKRMPLPTVTPKKLPV